MSTELNLDEVYVLAEQMERNAVRFYTLAAQVSDDTISADMFHHLAAMESEHELVFNALRTGTTVQPRTQYAQNVARHWPAIANGMLQDMERELAGRFDDKIAREDILREAMGFEKDSIVFFLGLKQMLPAGADRRKADALIREEMGHLILLGSQLAQLKPHALSAGRRPIAGATDPRRLPADQ